MVPPSPTQRTLTADACAALYHGTDRGVLDADWLVTRFLDGTALWDGNLLATVDGTGATRLTGLTAAAR